MTLTVAYGPHHLRSCPPPTSFGGSLTGLGSCNYIWARSLELPSPSSRCLWVEDARKSSPIREEGNKSGSSNTVCYGDRTMQEADWRNCTYMREVAQCVSWVLDDKEPQEYGIDARQMPGVISKKSWLRRSLLFRLRDCLALEAALAVVVEHDCNLPSTARKQSLWQLVYWMLAGLMLSEMGAVGGRSFRRCPHMACALFYVRLISSEVSAVGRHRMA
jgi:hypothetical protein